MVIGLDPTANRVVLAPVAETRSTSVDLADVIWHGSGPTADVLAQTRYRSTPVRALAERTKGGITVRFGDETAPVAPGQSVVLYQGDTVIGGGIARVDR